MLSITEAIVSYAVSAKADGSAWGKLVTEVTSLYSQCYDINVLKNQLKDAENDYKKEFGESQLPPAYRSAKSVAINAIQHGVVLRNDVGEPIGKSAVEAAIKAAKPKKEPVLKNTLQEWNKFADAWHFGEADKSDRDYIIGQMQGIILSYEA